MTYVPTMRTQLVAARTVAEALADLATARTPAPDAPILEIAGPREERLVEMARLLAARRGDAARVEEASDPRQSRRRDGRRVGRPAPRARAPSLAGPTFAEWLDDAECPAA